MTHVKTLGAGAKRTKVANNEQMEEALEEHSHGGHAAWSPGLSPTDPDQPDFSEDQMEIVGQKPPGNADGFHGEHSSRESMTQLLASHGIDSQPEPGRNMDRGFSSSKN
ncbi:unnamed protein product [Calypogeia fissa]